MKKAALILIALVLIIAAAAVMKDNIAKAVLIKVVKEVVGLDVQAQDVRLGFFKTDIGINNLYIYNPAGFTDRLIADVPRLYIDYDLSSFFKGKAHLEVLYLQLKEFVVVRNRDGRLNLNYVSGLSEKRPADNRQPAPERRKPQVKIDILRLKVGRVLYKDYTQFPVSITEYPVNIDETYKDITDVEKLVKLIITRSLINTAISRLADLNFMKLKNSLSGVIQSGKDFFRELENIFKLPAGE